MTEPAELAALRAALRALLAKHSDVRTAIERPGGYDETLWARLCGIGVPALGVPERFGGAGAGRAALHVAMDELGATLTPSPLLGSGVLSAALLLELDDTAARAESLARIADGGVIALAWTGRAGTWTPDAFRFDGDRLTGTAGCVLDGDLAEALVVIASDEDGLGAWLIQPADARCEHTPAMDLSRRLATVVLDDAPGVRLPGDAATALNHALDVAAVALSAEQVGAAGRILARAVAYTRDRVQFGRPIGSFQALQHRMADLHVLVEAARSASYAALDGTVAPSVAKAYCSEAFQTVAGECIQLFGGIGITWEHDAQLYFKRAHGSAQLFGSPESHVRRLEGAAGL